MQINIYKDHSTASFHAAEAIISTVENNPDSVLCLAAGDTPRLAYELMVKTALDQTISFARCTFIALDEWVGIEPNNEGSCSYFLNNLIFKPLSINTSQIYLFDSLSANLAEECKKMDETIIKKGGIDLMLAGVGMNGHIGFNEPGVSPHLYSHVINLDDTTRSVGQKYFKKSTALTQGITLGLKHVSNSKQLIMMATGSKKANVAKQALEEEVSIDMPAGIIQIHPQGIVMIDEEAAMFLKH